jgi:hypothetical protein
MSVLNLAKAQLIRPAPASQPRSSLLCPVHSLHPALDPIIAFLTTVDAGQEGHPGERALPLPRLR